MKGKTENIELVANLEQEQLAQPVVSEESSKPKRKTRRKKRPATVREPLLSEEKVSNAHLKDFSDPVFKILKTIQLVGRPCGFNELVRILREENSKYYRDPLHLTLETCGALQDFTRIELRLLMAHLLERGYLCFQNPIRETLSPTEMGLRFLDEPEPVLVSRAEVTVNTFERYFHRQLADLRKRMSKERNQAPYTIFTDHTIDMMVKSQPETLKELSLIRGMGDHRLASFGAQVIQLLDQIQADWHQLKSLKSIKKISGFSHQEVKRLHNEGFTIEEIAGMLGLKQTTVERYLVDFHMAGAIDMRPWIEKYLGKENLKSGADFFVKYPDTRLSEARDALGIEMNELFLARVYAQGYQPVPVRASA